MGVIGLIKIIVWEFVFCGINVNVVVFGFIIIDMIDKLDEKIKEVMLV